MGVALQHGTVHKCTGVAFVGVAAGILLLSFGSSGKLPLTAGGESSAATAPQAGSQHQVDDFLGSHLGEHLAQSGIAVLGNVLVDILRVDHAAVAQGNTHLLGVERGFIQGLGGVVIYHGFLIQQPLDDTAFEKVLGNDLRHIFRSDTAIKSAFGVHHHDGTQRAQAKAAGANDVDFFFQALGFDLFLQPFNDLLAVGGRTSRTSADQHV